MLNIIFVLPLLTLVLAWFFGTTPSARAGLLALTGLWVGAAWLVGTSELHLIVYGVAVFVLAPVVSIAIALQFGRQADEVPAEQVADAAQKGYEAYERLDPEEKQKLHKTARVVGKFTCDQAGKHFRRTGRKTAASIFSGAAKIL